MVEITIPRERKFDLYLKYDDKKYDISYSQKGEKVIIKDKEQDKVIKVFNKTIGFVVQADVYGDTHFIVSRYKKKDGKAYLKDYEVIDTDIKAVAAYENDGIDIETYRITDTTYLLRDDTIYNAEKGKTKSFKRVYHDESITNSIDGKSILVEEEKTAYLNYNIKDRLIYGIDPESFKITTRIWSDMQQRYIDVYTKEQIEELKTKLYEKRHYLSREDVDSVTMYFEVERYLSRLQDYYDAGRCVYKDNVDMKPDESFLQKIKKRG